MDPGSNAPEDTAPAPAAAVDPPTPTAAMLASARPVPSATAGYFRIHHVRFRTSGGGRGVSWDGEGLSACSQLDYQMVSGSQIPSKQETGGAADRLPQPFHKSYLHARDARPGPHPSRARLTDPEWP